MKKLVNILRIENLIIFLFVNIFFTVKFFVLNKVSGYIDYFDYLTENHFFGIAILFVSISFVLTLIAKYYYKENKEYF